MIENSQGLKYLPVLHIGVPVYVPGWSSRRQFTSINGNSCYIIPYLVKTLDCRFYTLQIYSSATPPENSALAQTI